MPAQFQLTRRIPERVWGKKRWAKYARQAREASEKCAGVNDDAGIPKNIRESNEQNQGKKKDTSMIGRETKKTLRRERGPCAEYPGKDEMVFKNMVRDGEEEGKTGERTFAKREQGRSRRRKRWCTSIKRPSFRGHPRFRRK